MAYILFYSDLPFKKYVILRFQIAEYRISSGFSEIKNPRADSGSASKTTSYMSFSKIIYDEKGANCFGALIPSLARSLEKVDLNTCVISLGTVEKVAAM